ncbi:MAG: sigma-70 family RNA polymerase sigma factor [Deltaproteobacteria bacterium]|nr:sigma-70 family RNA polymerase sigma factor [Deltaproteobacteria bacterium]
MPDKRGGGVARDEPKPERPTGGNEAGPPRPGSVRFNSPEWLAWERERVARARTGDRVAFGELYRAFASPLFAQVLVPRLGNQAAAEDVLAETFRTLLERLGQFDDQGTSIWFWLVRIAVNKATDMHRGRARRTRALVSFEGLLAPVLEAPPTPRDLTERASDLAALSGRVAEVLGRINPRYRRALEMRFLEERSRQECADALDMKLGTFDVLLLRAVRSFRTAWGAEGGDETPSSDPEES